MYVERIANRNSPPAILLRRAIVSADKIRKRALANLTHWPAAKIEAPRRGLRGEAVAAVGREALSMQRSLPMVMWRRRWGPCASSGSIGCCRWVAGSPNLKWTLRVAMIVARPIEPASKPATAGLLDEETATCSPGQVPRARGSR